MLVFCLDDAFFTANKYTGYEIDGRVCAHLFNISMSNAHKCELEHWNQINMNVDMIIILSAFTCDEIKLGKKSSCFIQIHSMYLSTFRFKFISVKISSSFIEQQYTSQIIMLYLI